MQYLLALSCWTYLAHGAILNVKQSKCSPPRSLENLKPVLIADLPLQIRLRIIDPVPSRSSTALNRSLLLEKYFPDEWGLMDVTLQKLTDRVMVLTASCPKFRSQSICSHFMLAQSPSGRVMWIKRVHQGEHHFYGFRYGWRQVHLRLESSNEVFTFQVCHYIQMRLAIEPSLDRPTPGSTSMRCALVDTDGRPREFNCGYAVRVFNELARRVSKARISYPDGIVRLFALKVLISFGFMMGYFYAVSALLEKIIK